MMPERGSVARKADSAYGNGSSALRACKFHDRIYIALHIGHYIYIYIYIVDAKAFARTPRRKRMATRCTRERVKLAISTCALILTAVCRFSIAVCVHITLLIPPRAAVNFPMALPCGKMKPSTNARVNISEIPESFFFPRF